MVLVKLVPIGIVDTMMFKLVLVYVEKIMNKEKIYGRGEKTYLGIVRLWTWYAKKYHPSLGLVTRCIYTSRFVISS